VQFGRYFEEFDVGATYKHWPGKTITEAEDHLFCLLTMNHHPLHSDAHYAQTQTQYSLALGMSVADISGKAIANLEVESLKHENPTFHGDTIYAETTVLDKKESSSKPDRGVVSVETRAFNQRGEQVCYFKRKVLVPKLSAGELQPQDTVAPG
jgi:acyl dehydratase